MDFHLAEKVAIVTGTEKGNGRPWGTEKGTSLILRPEKGTPADIGRLG
jgi:hypothetical protein